MAMKRRKKKINEERCTEDEDLNEVRVYQTRIEIYRHAPSCPPVARESMCAIRTPNYIISEHNKTRKPTKRDRIDERF